jgi:hypothetical protein
VVDHDVEAQDLESHGVVQTLRLTDAVDVSKGRLGRNDGFADDILHLLHELLGVTSFLRKDLQNGTERAFVATLPIVVCLLVVIRIFVQGVVRQVDKDVLHVPFCRPFVLLRAEASKSRLVQVDSQRRNAAEQDINA